MSARVVEDDCADALKEIATASVDLVVSSPPYGIGKTYERGANRLDRIGYEEFMRCVIAELARATSPTGSVCWQVGNHVHRGECLPLDCFFIPLFQDHGFRLQSRAVWTFGSGLHETRRFSGRYETLCRFARGPTSVFNHGLIKVETRPAGRSRRHSVAFDADAAFAAQSVWEIPNLKANHPERTGHPCQFPLELAERCVLALTRPQGLVLDPFLGSGTTACAAVLHGRNTLGIERDCGHATLARERVAMAVNGTLRRRDFGAPVEVPRGRTTTPPVGWHRAGGDTEGERR